MVEVVMFLDLSVVYLMLSCYELSAEVVVYCRGVCGLPAVRAAS